MFSHKLNLETVIQHSMPILLCAENKKNPSPDERLGEVTPEDVFILIR